MRLSELKGKSPEECASFLNVDTDMTALKHFLALGLPDKKSEEYRYFRIEAFLERDYRTLTYMPTSIEEGDKIVIVDGVVTQAPKGLRIYYEQCKAIDTDHFDPLYYLGHILSPHVIKIDLDGDADVEIAHHYTQSDTLINYRIMLANQANRHATLYETFHEDQIENTLILYGYDMLIAPDSTLRLLKTQKMSDGRYTMVASHRLNLEQRANAVIKSFDIGGDMGLQLIKADLGKYAHIDAGHLLYLNNDAQRGTISKIIHHGEHSTSHQEAKNILDGNARGIFDALIKVEHSAKYTKAHQNSKAILLHEKAYMVAKPQLEIYIDELEASHGSTTGQLDEKQLFYLQSRGIARTEARKMLVIAFANTLIEEVKDHRHQEAIKAAFDEAFYVNIDQ
jgi:Fe-S cluster assembly protein SufD